MAPPSQLVIASKAVERLVKEQGSYERELADQQARLDKLSQDIADGKDVEDGNGEFMVKQQRQAIDETNAIFGPLRKRLEAAAEKLHGQVTGADKDADKGEIAAAKRALENAKKALEMDDTWTFLP